MDLHIKVRTPWAFYADVKSNFRSETTHFFADLDAAKKQWPDIAYPPRRMKLATFRVEKKCQHFLGKNVFSSGAALKSAWIVHLCTKFKVHTDRVERVPESYMY